MGFRFVCPNTGHKIETATEIDDDDLLLRRESIGMQCSFCGGRHRWVFVATMHARERKHSPKAPLFVKRA